MDRYHLFHYLTVMPTWLQSTRLPEVAPSSQDPSMSRAWSVYKLIGSQDAVKEWMSIGWSWRCKARWLLDCFLLQCQVWGQIEFDPDRGLDRSQGEQYRYCWGCSRRQDRCSTPGLLRYRLAKRWSARWHVAKERWHVHDEPAGRCLRIWLHLSRRRCCTFG